MVVSRICCSSMRCTARAIETRSDRGEATDVRPHMLRVNHRDWCVYPSKDLHSSNLYSYSSPILVELVLTYRALIERASAAVDRLADCVLNLALPHPPGPPRDITAD